MQRIPGLVHRARGGGRGRRSTFCRVSLVEVDVDLEPGQAELVLSSSGSAGRGCCSVGTIVPKTWTPKTLVFSGVRERSFSLVFALPDRPRRRRAAEATSRRDGGSGSRDGASRRERSVGREAPPLLRDGRGGTARAGLRCCRGPRGSRGTPSRTGAWSSGARRRRRRRRPPRCAPRARSSGRGRRRPRCAVARPTTRAARTCASVRSSKCGDASKPAHDAGEAVERGASTGDEPVRSVRQRQHRPALAVARRHVDRTPASRSGAGARDGGSPAGSAGTSSGDAVMSRSGSRSS